MKAEVSIMRMCCSFYKEYMRPKASGRELLIVSRCGVAVAGLLAWGLSCLLYGVNISVNFLFLIVSPTPLMGFVLALTLID